MARDNLLTYPDFNEESIIKTNDRDFQLGAVIKQKGKPTDYYSIKPTDYHNEYTFTEKELTSIVETLKGFRTILLGHKLRIYTDS